jgi:hypothetical protein
MAQLLGKLGLTKAGGNYANMKKTMQRLGVECDHWKGQLWSKGERLKDWSQYNRAGTLKPHLLKERGHKCERCHKSEWQGYKIPIEIHHVNGDKTKNDYDNLQLLCPNCHFLTDNFRNRKD